MQLDPKNNFTQARLNLTPMNIQNFNKVNYMDRRKAAHLQLTVLTKRSFFMTQEVSQENS